MLNLNPVHRKPAIFRFSVLLNLCIGKLSGIVTPPNFKHLSSSAERQTPQILFIVSEGS